MQEVLALCKNAKNFPRNFEQQNSSSYNLSLYEQLNTHAARLFSGEDESVLDFLELSSREKGTGPPCTPAVWHENSNSPFRFPAKMYKDRNPTTDTPGADHYLKKS